MRDNIIDISAKSPSNKVSPHITPGENNHNTHSALDEIQLIKNNTINKENSSHTTLSSLWSINKFLSKIKDHVLRQSLSQPATDIELDEILSQGRKLSQDSETLHNLLNNKKYILPSSTLSLTTKTGLALGGMLLSSELAGGVVYYSQRTGREQYNESHNATYNNQLSTSPLPLPFGTYNPLYSQNHTLTNFSQIKNNNNKNQTNDKSANSNFSPLRIREESQPKKTKRHNVSSPCNYAVVNQRKNLSLLFYIYSTRQLDSCLTESFNQGCQNAHKNARDKKGCFYIPHNLVLKIKNNFCMCPPPDWLEMVVISPPPSFLQMTNPPMILIQRQSTAEPTTTTSFTPTTPAEFNTTQLYNSQTNTFLPKKSSDKPDLFIYENENGNLTLPETLRKISKIIASPGAAVLTAGKTAINQRDIDNTQFYQKVKKVEAVIDNILMWIPTANRVFISASIVADTLNLYSDLLEGKKMDRDTLTDLLFQVTSLSKDIISSVTTDDMKKLSNDKDIAENQKFLHPFSFEENNLMMMISGSKKKIKVDKKFNHLYTQDTDKFIFYNHSYDYGERWATDKYQLNNDIEDMIKVASKTWQDPENIYFFKNSSPPLYSNGMILRYHGDLYLLINGVPHRAEEIPVKNGIYRYLIKNEDKYTPVIYGRTSWVIEESNSPLASQKLRTFLDDNHNAKNNLVSKNINHQDVSPLTSFFKIQSDKKSNKYLKINDQYYLIKTSQYGSYYIEGSHDLLELKYSDHQYHIKNSPFEDVFRFHKIPINTFKGTLSDPHFFLDKKVIDEIRRIYLLPENKIEIDINEIFKTMKDSNNIEKAITANGIDYILSDNKFIQIHSNGDDTYILGDPNNDNRNILIYKNQFSNTYFKIPKTKRKWQKLIEKPTHCVVKRQPEGACAIDYYESYGISSILEENTSQSIIINDYDQQLESHNNFISIYQDKGNNNNLYYQVKDNIFFHVRKNLSGISSFTPSIFIIYGKSANQQINLGNIIARVCVVKDFDTKKIIFSTPNEAQKVIFNIPQRLSELFLRMQEQSSIHRDITAADLKKIKEKQSLSNDMDNLKEMFHRSGKKLISSIEHADSVLKDQINIFFKSENMNNLEINNLKKLEESKAHPIIKEVCNNAFKKTINNIDKAITTIKSSGEILNQYVTEQLGISDTRACDYFTSGLKNKLERMKMYFNESNKKNIMIMTKKAQAAPNIKILSEAGEQNLGFTITYDPLDRIFINAADIEEPTEQLAPPEDQSQPDSPSFSQPDAPKDTMYLTNLISDTMLHESVHALGSPDDYLYLSINEEGYINNIKESIEQIEKAIATKKMEKLNFEYFSKLYFMSNPLYNDFTLASLNRPEILTELFRQDSFYRAILLLKNPDTISLLVRELANPSLLEEQEIPTSSVKKPVLSLTSK